MWGDTDQPKDRDTEFQDGGDDIEIHGDGSQQPEPDPTNGLSAADQDTAHVGDTAIRVFLKDDGEFHYEALAGEWAYTELGLFVNGDGHNRNDRLFLFESIKMIEYVSD